MLSIAGEHYSLFFKTDIGATIAGGSFGEITIAESPLFSVRLLQTETKEKLTLSSRDFSVTEAKAENDRRIVFILTYKQITVTVTATGDATGVSFKLSVENLSDLYSVLSVSYPMPTTEAPYFDLFLPSTGGKLVENAGVRGFSYSEIYPSHIMCMPYFAVCGKTSGIYLAIEDKDAAPKRMTITAGDGKAAFSADFFAEGATDKQNSFSLYGVSRWSAFCGDWYDATMLYRAFVMAEAEWLPAIDENGRPDTPDSFKEIPFWISDYIPNSESQGENRPMSLSAGSDVYDKSYWIDAPIALKRELNVPVAYHVYNWHEIPFNIEYPHFLPAKSVFIEGAKKLRAEGIRVFPYINALSWERYDSEMPHATNFDNTGIHGAVLDEDGNIVIEHYPQTTRLGHTSHLAPMCPTFKRWWDLIENLTREMEETLPIDGIYYDQISAAPAYPCYNPAHSHKKGGGNYWCKGYTEMMQRIRANRPQEAFYFSECNAEPYMKGFDGYLTWLWAQNGEVPAFSAIYGGGYIQLLGRFMIGKKKLDYDFFKFMIAKSLLYGQQIGWCKADVLYRPAYLDFLKKTVQLRYEHKALWNASRMLRPPKTETNLPTIRCTSAGFWFEDEDVVFSPVLSGAWRYRDGRETVIFIVNIADAEASFSLSFSLSEYGISKEALPPAFTLNGDRVTVKESLSPNEWKVFRLK